ncbi:DUF397 domain-containing protein [Actinoallomurus sp. CA-150999]|uniref:DUF397 domain-containing protein n=1 Tax=Actinoallomurus sp. CA-150999 TaxID=3239887 RepID=UPI003D9034B8
MTTLHSPGPPWRTSSYSADQGGTCVQVAAVWRTSSHSANQGGECVQVAVIRAGGRSR